MELAKSPKLAKIKAKALVLKGKKLKNYHILCWIISSMINTCSAQFLLRRQLVAKKA